MIIRVECWKPDRSTVSVGFLKPLRNLIVTVLVSNQVVEAKKNSDQYVIEEAYFKDYGVLTIKTSKTFDSDPNRVLCARFVDAVETAITEFVDPWVYSKMSPEQVNSAYPYVRKLEVRTPYEITLSCSKAVDTTYFHDAYEV